MNHRTRFIIAGGFLGAGKTTLLFETAKILVKDGKKVGLITNDQAAALVDTALLLKTGVAVAEVSGSCFCCNFNGLIDSVKQLQAGGPLDYIIAEAVGSCTDLSATIIQPLKDKFNDALEVAPLAVLTDPLRLAASLGGGIVGLHTSAGYIFSKQLEESDIIVITKADTVDKDELESLLEKVKLKYPAVAIVALSARTGNGVQEWLKIVKENAPAGQHILELDYDQYAEGEAVLGWLNASLSLEGEQIDWDVFAADFLHAISHEMDDQATATAHVKLILASGPLYMVGNITGTVDTLSVRGVAGISNQAQLIINARAGTTTDELNRVVRSALITTAKAHVAVNVETWECLTPGYPKPTHRYNRVV